MESENVDRASALAYSGAVTMIGAGATRLGWALSETFLPGAGFIAAPAVGALAGTLGSGAAAGSLAALSAYEDHRSGAEILDAFWTSAWEGGKVGLFGSAVGGIFARTLATGPLSQAAHAALVAALSTAWRHYEDGLDVSRNQQHHDGFIPTITIGAHPLNPDWFGCPDGRRALFTTVLPAFPEGMAHLECPWMMAGHYPPEHYIHSVTEKLHSADMSEFLVNWWECCGDGRRLERTFAPAVPPKVDTATGMGEMFAGYSESRRSLEKAVDSWYAADSKVVETVRMQGKYQEQVQAGINTLCEQISSKAGLLPKAPVVSKDQDCLSYLDNAIAAGSTMIDDARAEATANGKDIRNHGERAASSGRAPEKEPEPATPAPTPWENREQQTNKQPTNYDYELVAH